MEDSMATIHCAAAAAAAAAASTAIPTKSPPMFTIEQIELIRRLRNSGITKDQVMQAFEELERMDAELGRTFNMALCGGSGSGGGSSSNGSSNSSTPVAGGSTTAPNSSTTAATAAAASLVNPFTYLQLQQHLLRQLTVAAHINNTTANHVAAGDAALGDCVIARSPSQNSESPPNTPQAAVQHMSGGYLLTPSLPRGLVNGHHDSFVEDQVELQEFMKQGDASILDEIRKFVMRYNIKQHFIAEMAKISQAYVSRYFRGEVGEMSERTKIAIYSWYLTCKKNPWKLKQICPNSGVKRMVSDSGDLIPLKRERFTFKSAHLAILEKYYNMDPYPDSQTREQIVEECNRAMTKPDRDLTEREKVTINVVTNWFNNRRKEAKQKLRQQGIQTIDLSQGLGSVTPSWDQLPHTTAAHIVCQPDIEPSESDQSQDAAEMDVLKASSGMAMLGSAVGVLEDSLLETVVKEEPDSDM